MSRPASSSDRSGRVWSARSARSGHDNEALDRDQEPPAAMEAEEYVDGRVVVNNAYDNGDLDEPHGCWHNFKKGVRCEYHGVWRLGRPFAFVFVACL